MTLIVLIPIPILIYATRLFQVAVRKSFQDVRNQVARINVFIQEHVTGMNIVQIFNQEEREAYKFENINREHRDAHIRGIWAYSVFFPVVELLSGCQYCSHVVVGSRCGHDFTNGAGCLTFFFSFYNNDVPADTSKWPTILTCFKWGL
jgi:ATP-binding cassette subfamily B multidrug efflux pump